ncbi:MAG: patatin [Saprospirales bacterium]|nr:MAG: patatin [Saprospirales bacterium]
MSKKIGLALSGGGSRAAAHLGAIKAFNEAEIKFDWLAGTSAGAMVAVLAANKVDPELILKEIKSLSLFHLVNFSYSLSGLSSLKKIEKLLTKLLDCENFEDLKIPVKVIASSLNTGRIKVFESGEIIPSVIASSSIPIVFPPVKINSDFLIDGGLLMNLPVEPLCEECDFVVGFSITPVLEQSDQEYDRLTNIGFRTFELSVLANVKASKEQCDLFIEPGELSSFGIFSFNKMDEMFEIGYSEARKHIEEIKNATVE